MRIAAFFVAALAVCAQPSRDPVEVLGRARAKLLDTVDRLPRYTCVQTVDRRYFEQPSLPSRPSCQDALNAHDARQANLQLTDRLRLDVAVANGEEIYSWAGAGRFESKHIPELIGGGPIGTGSFGPFLISIFANPGVRIEYQGEETVDSRALLAYSFHVPREISHYELQAATLRRTIAFDGTFWLDPETADLRRLRVHTGRLAEDLGICEANTTVVFERVPIGAGVYLLPRESRLESVSTGLESENLTTWSSCREYRGESVIHFGEAEPVAPTSPAAANLPSGGLPRGLRFVLAFQQKIDSDTAAAGDAVVAKVLKDVTDPHSKRVLVPAGAMARGRITRLAHQLSPRPYFLVAILFETLEWNGVSARFSAVLDPKSGPLGRFSVSAADLGAERKAGRVASPAMPGMEFSAGRTLVFPSTSSRYVVPRGYESHWLTGDTLPG